MDIVDKIMRNKNNGKSNKIIKLWCVVQLNYRQPLGDKAWKAMQKVTDVETVSAIAFVTGFSVGMGLGDCTKSLKALVSELEE